MRKATLIALGTWLVAPAAPAAILYQQSPSANTVTKSAWYAPDGLDGDQYVWDAFTLTAPASLTQINWSGGYTNYLSGAGTSPVYDFTVELWTSIPAGIQPDILNGRFAQWDVGGNAGETATGTPGLYNYSFTLPKAVSLQASTKYWIRIYAWQGVTPFYSWPPDWGLQAGGGGDGSHFTAVTGGTNGGGTLYYLGSGDAAFSLIGAASPVPEPATLGLLAAAVPLLLRRRKPRG